MPDNDADNEQQVELTHDVQDGFNDETPDDDSTPDWAVTPFNEDLDND
jgi:hypothetical protein